jgi:tRNA (cmo5U34)-methyltransferase
VKTKSNFNALAPIYDQLAKLVFGKSIVDSQTWFLDQVPLNAKILILGGGTGWLLEELIKKNPTCEVWYVEASTKMIEKTQSRVIDEQVHFIQGTEEDIPSQPKYDFIITNFYLDLFSNEKLKSVIQRINEHTSQSTIWLATDFVNNDTWWHRWMLKIMYIFFTLVCNIEASYLPDWSKALSDQRWSELNSKSWHRKFIKSTLWRRG